MSIESKKEVLAKKYFWSISEILAESGKLLPEDATMETPLASFLPVDLAVRRDFVNVVEKKAGISVSDSAMEACRTVGDLCRALAEMKIAASSHLKAYAIAYRDKDGVLHEEVISARNHNEACAELAERGITDIVGIDRAGSSDDEYRMSSHRTFSRGFLLPLIVAVLVGGAAVLFLMWRRGLLQKFFE